MNRVLYRHLVRSLLWLLVAALPLQGFAAAMRTCCLQQNQAAVVALKAEAPHCHAMADMADMQEHAGKTIDMGHGHDCGNHGACTVGATAPPPMAALHPLMLGAPQPPAALPLLFAGHIPAGPERPPRSPRSA
jgi:hypothetical protein